MPDNPTTPEATSETFWSTSPSTEKIMPDLVAALGEIPAIQKDQEATITTRSGGSYTYTFANLATVLSLVRPVLAKHGLAIIQVVSSPDTQRVSVCTTIFHKSGEWIKFDPLSMSTGGTPQETGSVITYTRKYSIMPCLGLAAEDDDGAAASQPSRQSEQRNSAPQPSGLVAPPAEPRSEDERHIRQMIANLPGAFIDDVRRAFKAKFGFVGELDVERHGEALTWTQEVVAEIEARTAGGGANLADIVQEVDSRNDRTPEVDVVADREQGEIVPSDPLASAKHGSAVRVAVVKLASKNQITAIKAMAQGTKIATTELAEMASQHVGRIVEELSELTSDEAVSLLEILNPTKG